MIHIHSQAFAIQQKQVIEPEQATQQMTSRSRTSLITFCFLLGMVMAPARGVAQSPPKIEYPEAATYTPKTDSLGFRWDLQSYGYIQYGTNQAFSNAMALSVNGTGFSSTSTQRKMSADNNHYQLGRSSTVGGIYVTRRLKFDLKNSLVRWVDSFRNPSSDAKQVTVTCYTQLGRGPALAVLTNSGEKSPTELSSSDYGVVAVGDPQQQQTSVLFYLQGRRGKVTPTVQISNNNQFRFNYVISIPPGETVSILSGLAQRKITGVPGRSELSRLFRPFRSRSFTKDIDRDLLKTIVNGGGSGGAWQPDDLAGMESLEITPGVTDVLAIGEQTRLQGTATCTAIAMQTSLGRVEVPLEEVAAIVGPKGGRSKQRVFLRDGQIYSGVLEISNLQFTMNTGLTLDISSENLDRLVLREKPGDQTPKAEAYAMLYTRSGDRLAVARSVEQRIMARTPWGNREISMDQIEELVPHEDPIGHHLRLRDGSRFFAYLSPAPLKLTTLGFGDQTFSPVSILSLTANFLQEEESDFPEEIEINAPHLILAGENIVMGSIELDQLSFQTSGQMIPVPPNQIRLLKRSGTRGPNSTILYEAQLWDSGTVIGELKETVLPMRSAGQDFRIPLRDIVEIHVPTPTVPAATRARIARLIRDMGHPDFKTREESSRALQELGYLAKQQLADAVKETTDPEIKRRAEALLEDLDK